MSKRCSTSQCRNVATERLDGDWLCDLCYDLQVVGTQLHLLEKHAPEKAPCSECGRRQTIRFAYASAKHLSDSGVATLVCLHCRAERGGAA